MITKRNDNMWLKIFGIIPMIMFIVALFLIGIVGLAIMIWLIVE
ncbi:hypothetical protein [Pediococcus parvulus]|nr:hypothetical protein [Pediococcus parvulus]